MTTDESAAPAANEFEEPEKKKREAKKQDPELKAMGSVASALDELTEGAQERVLAWASSRYCGLERVPAATEVPQ